MNQGRQDDAIKDFTKALSIKSDYSPAAANLSGVYFQNEDYEKALEMANKAVKMDKNNAAAYVNRGMTKKPVEAEIEITDNETGKLIETFTTNSATGKFAALKSTF